MSKMGEEYNIMAEMYKNAALEKEHEKEEEDEYINGDLYLMWGKGKET